MATHECEKVGMDYFDAAPMRFAASEEVGVSAQRLFDIFLDAESWTKWVTAITNVEWTSAFPLQVGSTRSVTMLGGMVGHEEFIAWDEPHHMAFRFNSASMNPSSAPSSTVCGFPISKPVRWSFTRLSYNT